MSTNLIINENTNVKSDRCLTSFQDKNNEIMFNYSFLPSISNNQNTRNSYIDSTKTLGILQDTNYDISGKNINESTLLRNGVVENTGPRRELDTRLFPGAPLMAVGQSELKNTDLSSRLKFGEDTRTSKSANATSSYSANNFIPLVPSIAENIQNVDHIIPTFWVRGGMSSRAVIRNIDYMKSCGLNR
jgi:hypothetical protein